MKQTVPYDTPQLANIGRLTIGSAADASERDVVAGANPERFRSRGRLSILGCDQRPILGCAEHCSIRCAEHRPSVVRISFRNLPGEQECKQRRSESIDADGKRQFHEQRHPISGDRRQRAPEHQAKWNDCRNNGLVSSLDKIRVLRAF